MRTIHYDDPHRKRHFEFFARMEMPHFGLVAQIPFEPMYDYIKANNLHFTSTMVYLISRSANSVPQLRRRIREGTVVEHDAVHPSFSVQTNASEVFSFCYVDYQDDYHAFAAATKAEIDRMQHQPNLEDDDDRDDYLFLSSIPWVHFTGLTHAMHLPAIDSVPRITWGKLGPRSSGLTLPLGIQAHHAVVDGKHVGQFYEMFESLVNNPESALS